MAVNTLHPALKQIMPVYDQIEDCLAGEIQVKRQGEKYLPHPSGGSGGSMLNSIVNIKERPAVNVGQLLNNAGDSRYDDYKARAQFVDYTNRQLETLVGLAFSKDVIKELPAMMDMFVENVNGNGLGLVQLAKQMFAYVLAYGRAGLLVEYPMMDKPTTVGDSDSGRVLPTIRLVKPKELINWFGTPTIDTVVVSEMFEQVDDFEVSYVNKFKSFHLVDGVAHFQLHCPDKDEGFVVEAAGTLTNASSKPLSRLPLFTAGSENNDWVIDRPPFLGISSVNLSQYRSSADTEEGAFFAGNATYIISNANLQDLEEAFPDGIRVGSKYVLTLPAPAAASVLQGAPNAAAQALMGIKDEQMRALGAVRADQMTVAKTATEALLTETIRNGSLNNVANNVSNAMTEALKLALEYMTPDLALQDDIRFEIDVSAGLVGLDPAAINALVQLGSSSYLVTEEIRDVLKKLGIAQEEYDDQLMPMTQFGMDAPPPSQEEQEEDEEEETSEEPMPQGEQEVSEDDQQDQS